MLGTLLRYLNVLLDLFDRLLIFNKIVFFIKWNDGADLFMKLSLGRFLKFRGCAICMLEPLKPLGLNRCKPCWAGMRRSRLLLLGVHLVCFVFYA